MSKYYLLNYDNRPLGIYNKMFYLLDYILEIIRFPGKAIDIFKIRIHYLEVNKAYPLSKILFINKNNKLYLEEEGDKKIELSSETFKRFKKIRQYYDLVKKDTTKNTDDKPQKLTEDEIKLQKEQQEEINKQKKETIHKMNRLNHLKKTLENWQNKFASDIKLYNNFKEKLANDEDFKIPELFTEQYKFFTLLDTENNNFQESFTEYFIQFNQDSNLDISELNEILESESENENSDKEE